MSISNRTPYDAPLPIMNPLQAWLKGDGPVLIKAIYSPDNAKPAPVDAPVCRRLIPIL